MAALSGDSHTPTLKGGGSGRECSHHSHGTPTGVVGVAGGVDEKYALTSEELDERLRAYVEAASARREARKSTRDALNESRQRGLRQRHADKLARQEPPSVPQDPHRAAAPVAPPADRNRGRTGPAEQALMRSTFGAALRRARAARRLSQQSLAALAGCHRRTVQRMEGGQLRPTTALVDALAHALAVPPGWSAAGRREALAELRAELIAAAGPSLVASTSGGERRRRRRLRKARLAATTALLPGLRAQRGLPPVRVGARPVPDQVAQAARSYR